MEEVGGWWSVTSSSLNPLCPKSKTVRIQLIEPTLVLSVNIWCYSRMLLEALALIFNSLTKYSLHIHTLPEVSSAQHGFINLICLQKCFGASNRLVSLPDAQLTFLTWLWRQTLEKFSPFSGWPCVNAVYWVKKKCSSSPYKRLEPLITDIPWDYGEQRETQDSYHHRTRES